jgi:hypothetical protein
MIRRTSGRFIVCLRENFPPKLHELTHVLHELVTDRLFISFSSRCIGIPRYRCFIQMEGIMRKKNLLRHMCMTQEIPD